MSRSAENYKWSLREDNFRSWRPQKVMAALLYGLEHIDPAHLSRPQWNKVQDRCRQVAEMGGETSRVSGQGSSRSDGSQYQHLDNRSSEELWFEAMEILNTVRLDKVPKQAFAAMRACMECLDRDIKEEELRRYR